MKKLKDFFYDKNDILLVILILIVAGFLIWWRVDIIMSYPDTIDVSTVSKEKSQKAAVPQEKTEAERKADKKQEKEKALIYDSEGKLTKNVTVTIAGETAEEQVHYLVEAGLFKSYGDFEKICTDLGTDPVKIKASTFNFSKGATQQDIARIVTSD